MHSNSSKTRPSIFEETFIIRLFKIQTLKKWARDGLYATYVCVLAFLLIAGLAILKTAFYSTPCQIPTNLSTTPSTTTENYFHKPCPNFFIPFRKRYILRSPLLFRLSPVSSIHPCSSRHSRFSFITCLVLLPCLSASQLRPQPSLLLPPHKSPQNPPVLISFGIALSTVDTCELCLSGMTNEGLVNHLKENDTWKNCEKIYLQLTNHRSEVIKKNWLSVDVKINELKFINSYIQEIGPNAFDGNQFSAMKNFEVENNKVGIFIHENIFGDNNNLKAISFKSSLITRVDTNAFKNLVELTDLRLPRSIRSTEVLKNITADNKFKKLQLFDISENSLENISPDIFKGMPGLISLYLLRSGIETIEDYSFTNLQNLVLLSISNNLIETMNEAVGINSKIQQVEAENNKWHCDCKLEWFKKYFKTVDKSPTCSTPKEHSGKRFLEVDFHCDENPETTEGSSPSSSSTTTPPTSNISTTTATPVPSSTPNASTSTSTSSSISTEISYSTSTEIPEYHQCDFSVIGTDRMLEFDFTNCNDKSKIKNISIHSTGNDWQMINVQKKVKNLKDDTSYVICILYDVADLIQPLQCKAARTLPSEKEKIWIPNKFKSMICGIFVGSLFILFIFGAATAFCVIKKNPEVLKGSDRVLIVKRNGVAALILPKGYETPSQDYTEGSYYHGNNSTISGNSSVYMRPVPPSVSDFNYWREKYYGTGFAPSLPPRNEEPYYSEALETGPSILM